MPLTSDIIATIDSLPMFKGQIPIFDNNWPKFNGIGSKIKERVNRRMRLTFCAMARRHGEDPA